MSMRMESSPSTKSFAWFVRPAGIAEGPPRLESSKEGFSRRRSKASCDFTGLRCCRAAIAQHERLKRDSSMQEVLRNFVEARPYEAPRIGKGRSVLRRSRSSCKTIRKIPAAPAGSCPRSVIQAQIDRSIPTNATLIEPSESFWYSPCSASCRPCKPRRFLFRSDVDTSG